MAKKIRIPGGGIGSPLLKGLNCVNPLPAARWSYKEAGFPQFPLVETGYKVSGYKAKSDIK